MVPLLSISQQNADYETQSDVHAISNIKQSQINVIYLNDLLIFEKVWEIGVRRGIEQARAVPISAGYSNGAIKDLKNK